MNDGGQAFPHGNPTDGGDIGMTLRDWLAGQALNGMNANPDLMDYITAGKLDNLARDLAKVAYIQADAMLEEGGKDDSKD